jgi:hypothetical protein
VLCQVLLPNLPENGWLSRQVDRSEAQLIASLPVTGHVDGQAHTIGRQIKTDHKIDHGRACIRVNRNGSPVDDHSAGQPGGYCPGSFTHCCCCSSRNGLTAISQLENVAAPGRQRHALAAHTHGAGGVAQIERDEQRFVFIGTEVAVRTGFLV